MEKRARKTVKIIWLDRKGLGYVGAPHTRHEFEQAVAKKSESVFAGEGWPLYREDESIQDTVKRVMPDCDWVIDKDNHLHKKKPKRRKYKIGLFLTDLHAKHHYNITNPVGHITLINKAGYDAVFLRYPLLYGTHYDPKIYSERLKCEVFWIPWSVNVERFYPRKEKYDVGFIGMTYGCYPLRRDIWNGIYYAARGYKIYRGESPQGSTYDRSFEKLSEEYPVGDEYAELLGSIKIFPFGCSIYRYPVQKLFEVAASGCLMMVNEPAMAKDLGFISGQNYINIDIHTWEEALEYFLENEKERATIAERGKHLTREHHSHEVRADQFLEVLER